MAIRNEMKLASMETTKKFAFLQTQTCSLP